MPQEPPPLVIDILFLDRNGVHRLGVEDIEQLALRRKNHTVS